MRGLVLVHYFILRTVLGAKARLRPLLRRCRHCRIFFLTDPRNRGRTDLGCPFGCKDAHRRKRSGERSVVYNRTTAGKLKKKQHNEKRRDRVGKKHDPDAESGSKTPSPEPDDIEFDAAIVEHVRLVTRLIEGRQVSRAEVLEMPRRAVRQHSLAREMTIDYVPRALKEKPERPP